MIRLEIDTTSNKQIRISLFIHDKEDNLIQNLENNKAQIVLPLIQKLLKKHKISVNDLNEITVCEGPGSYTGVRVGVSVANALSYALGIPVNKKIFDGKNPLVEPIYG